MSFIYAEKYYNKDIKKELIIILCDTRIGLGEGSRANISDIQMDLIKQYGVIKTTICSSDLCVSFAGNNIRYAAELFLSLKEKKSFNMNDVTDLAYAIHMKAEHKDDIEFIISYYTEKGFCIDCIKDRKKYLDCQNAWIGSFDAFKAFQEYRVKHIKETGSVHKHTLMAFDDVVKGCCDTTVGGFSVGVIYNYKNNAFEYAWKKSINSSKIQTVQAEEKVYFYTSVEDGGFVYEIFPVSIQMY